MLNAIPMVISKESFEQIFTFAEDNSALAKNLCGCPSVNHRYFKRAYHSSAVKEV